MTAKEMSKLFEDLRNNALDQFLFNHKGVDHLVKFIQVWVYPEFDASMFKLWARAIKGENVSSDFFTSMFSDTAQNNAKNMWNYLFMKINNIKGWGQWHEDTLMFNPSFPNTHCGPAIIRPFNDHTDQIVSILNRLGEKA